MKVSIFASGSTGNAMLVQSGSTNILLDAGLSMRRIDQSVTRCGVESDDISGVLITHEHSDHITGLSALCKRHRIPVFAPHTVITHLRGMLPEIDEYLSVIPCGKEVYIGEIGVTAFHTPHDTDESVGYRFHADGRCFASATDMGCVTEEVYSGLMGADTVLVESNHDETMLRYGRYPVYLKRRILSDHGHLSNASCGRIARDLAESGTERIVLGHISRENNTPEIALRTVREIVGETKAELTCAPEYGFLSFEV